MKQSLDYRKILIRELETRKLRNSNFNVSSFARLLNVTPSRLSEILRGKVGISVAKAASISVILKLSESEKDLFLDLVCAEHGRNPREKEEAKKRISYYDENYFQYDQEHFASIADWYHHAILEMINLEKGKTALQMSKSLAIPISTVNEALKRLIRLGLINKDQKGYKAAPATIRATTSDIPSEAIKRLNEQILHKAIKDDLKTLSKVEPVFTVYIKDPEGVVIAEVDKVIHIKKKLWKSDVALFNLFRSGKKCL